MKDVQIARLLGKCNGYEIAYRLSEIRRSQMDPVVTQTEVTRIITEVLRTSAQEYPQEHKDIFADSDLLSQYSGSIFATLGVQYHQQDQAAAIE